MKANELREMQTAELTSKLADLKADLLELVAEGRALQPALSARHQPAG